MCVEARGLGPQVNGARAWFPLFPKHRPCPDLIRASTEKEKNVYKRPWRAPGEQRTQCPLGFSPFAALSRAAGSGSRWAGCA